LAGTELASDISKGALACLAGDVLGAPELGFVRAPLSKGVSLRSFLCIFIIFNLKRIILE
jgi:hypothetical protein